MTGLLRTAQTLALAAVGLLAVGLLLGGFVYFTNCPTAEGRFERSLTGYELHVVPYLWQAPEQCESHTMTRVVLGNLGVMEDVTSKVPGPPEPGS